WLIRLLILGSGYNTMISHLGLIRTFPNAIIEGSPEWSSDGKAIVVDGCKCQCGCQVISGAPECAIG
ncbi:PAAR domain-containing protein, partial [Klebsiella pneumoniae]|uniref:PAAR domain-containing protein n=1 Tax=Klebsiella pneumoniae TaxID=573 RepID=UPI00215B51FD